MTTTSERDAADIRLRNARIATLASLAVAWMAALTVPVLALFEEHRATWQVLGAVGVVLFGVALAGCLYAAATPWLRAGTRRALLVAFGGASVLSVPLLAPVAGPGWKTWAWVGAAVIGFVPVLLRRVPAAVAVVATLVVAAAVSVAVGESVWRYLVVTFGIGVAIAAMSSLPAWLWGLLVEARAGREAQARLAVTEERLRFARDVHDLLGHRLAVIALKAELAARLAPSDADRSAAESAEVQRLAATALTEMREAIHGYRAVDLDEQVTAVTNILTSSGVRCTVERDVAGALPEPVATPLALVLREASTNVLRHSRATWCTIAVTDVDGRATMTVSNDGAGPDATGPDEHSQGLHGMADRLSDHGGTLRTAQTDGVFTLTASLPTTR